MKISMNKSLKKLILALAVSVPAASVIAADCLPESDLRFPVPSSRKKSLVEMSGISQFQSTQHIENFKMLLGPVVKRQMGKELKIELDWENPRVNASATRDNDLNPVIILYGGMVRHPSLTIDGFYSILCHELGHHLGGAPKKFRGYSEKRSWSSAEGQADYYAATKCLPLIFNQATSSMKMDDLAPEKELDAVENSCGNDMMCSRILLAGLSVAEVFASLKNYANDPSLSENDRSQVWETDMGHPRPQCRLDTFKSGAQCSVSPSLQFDSLDARIGSCYSYKSDSENVIGARPRCWYYPSDL